MDSDTPVIKEPKFTEGEIVEVGKLLGKLRDTNPELLNRLGVVLDVIVDQEGNDYIVEFMIKGKFKEFTMLEEELRKL